MNENGFSHPKPIESDCRRCPDCGQPFLVDKPIVRIIDRKTGQIRLVQAESLVCTNNDCSAKDIKISAAILVEAHEELQTDIIWSQEGQITDSENKWIVGASTNVVRSEEELYASKAQFCNFCCAPLKSIGTTEVRIVRTLAGSRIIKEKLLICSNEECVERRRASNGGKLRPLIVRSPEVEKIVWPKKHFGLDVLIKVGQLRMDNRWTGEKIQEELRTEYQLDISVSTIYSYIDLYEALAKGILAKHSEEIAKRLHEQILFIIIWDATQLHGNTKLYRAIDYLSGFCLGTLLVPEGNKPDIDRWRKNIIDTYGSPDYTISDGEDAFHQSIEGISEIPHGDCWQHALGNIWKKLLKSWRIKARNFLKKHSYRAQLNNIRKELETNVSSTPSGYGQAVKAILDLFLVAPTKHDPFAESMAETLKLLQDALALLNKWERRLQAQIITSEEVNEKLRKLRELKQQFSEEEQRNWFQQPFFQENSFFIAFCEIHSCLKAICKDKKFNKLLREYTKYTNEFLILKSWLDESQVRRLEKLIVDESFLPKQLSEEMRKRLTKNLARVRKELETLPPSRRAWQWKHGEPDLSFAQKARQLLDRIIKRWQQYGKHDNRYQEAVGVLMRQYDNLLVFLEHPLIPATNQAIETDNGELKRIWRQCSGSQDKPYTLDYHGDGLSATRNFHPGIKTPSPLERLGFTEEEIKEWYHTCPYDTIKTISDQLKKYREPRRLKLKIRHEGLLKTLDWTVDAWLDWALTKIREELDNSR